MLDTVEAAIKFSFDGVLPSNVATSAVTKNDAVSFALQKDNPTAAYRTQFTADIYRVAHEYLTQS